MIALGRELTTVPSLSLKGNRPWGNHGKSAQAQTGSSRIHVHVAEGVDESPRLALLRNDQSQQSLSPSELT